MPIISWFDRTVGRVNWCFSCSAIWDWGIETENLRSCPIGYGICLTIVDHVLCCFSVVITPMGGERAALSLWYLIIHLQYFSSYLYKLGLSWIGSPNTQERETPVPTLTVMVLLNWKMSLPAGRFELLFYWTNKQMRGLICKLWWFIQITKGKLGYYYTKQKRRTMFRPGDFIRNFSVFPCPIIKSMGTRMAEEGRPTRTRILQKLMFGLPHWGKTPNQLREWARYGSKELDRGRREL